MKVPIQIYRSVQSKGVNVGVKVEKIPSSVKRHNRASVPIGGKGVFYCVIPGTLCGGVEFSKEFPVELKVRTAPLGDGVDLVGVIKREQNVLMEVLTKQKRSFRIT
jgi:hypothetical protein